MSQLNVFHKHILSIIELHRALKDDYIDHTYKHNFVIIYTGAVLSLFMQFANIVRVLSSNAALTTANNQFYFSFYIALFIVALLALILRNHWPKKTTHIYYIQLILGSFYILWNLLLNSFTLNMQTSSSVIIFTSALIFTSILFHYKPIHTMPVQITSYLLFIALNYKYLSQGNIINITICVVTTIFSTLILYVQNLQLIHSQLKLISTNQELQNSEDNLRLGLEKHQFIMNETNLFSFDWDLKKDIIYPSRNCSETLNWPSCIVHPYTWIPEHDFIFPADQEAYIQFLHHCVEQKKRDSIEIRIKDNSLNYTWYRLQVFIQYDHNGKATMAIGVLLNIDGTTRLIENLNQQLYSHIEGAKQYLEQIKDTQEQTIIYRHDMRHSLKLMEQLAHQGNLEKLCSYLAETHSKLESIVPNYYCENQTVNLILGSFSQIAHKKQINFVTDVVLPPELPISDTDLCSLLFNLLENSLTAASDVAIADSKRYVKIRAAYNFHKLLIFTENDFDGDVQIKDDLPVPSSNHPEHGFGVKSIVSIVDKYNGLYTFDANNQVFFAKILLEI